MPRESALQRAAHAWQASIAAHETEQQRLLLRRWRAVERDIHRRIQAVERRLAAAAARGQSPGVTLLYERGRLAELRDQVERALADFGDTWVRRVTVDRQAAAREAITWSERFLRDQLGPDVTLQRLPTDVVMQAVSFQAPGGPLDQLMREAGTRAGHAIAEGLTTGLTSGQNPNVIARRIREHVVPTYRRRAVVIARTETMRAVRAATLERYKTVADLLQGWVWWASTDRTTCATCWAMHGTEHPLSEDMDSHPACRCVALPAAEGLGVDLGPTGPDLFAASPADVQLAVLGPKRYGLYRSGELTLPDMVQEHWSPRWGMTRNTASIAASQRAASLRRATKPHGRKQSA